MVPVPAVLIKKTVKRNDQATTPTDNTPDILPLHPMPGYRGEDSNGLNGFPPRFSDALGYNRSRTS